MRSSTCRNREIFSIRFLCGDSIEQNTIAGVALLLLVVVIVAAVAVIYNGGFGLDNSGDDGSDDVTIPDDIQTQIDNLVSDRQYVADNMVLQIIDAFANADPELLDDNASRAIAQSAFEFTDAGKEFDAMDIFFDSSCKINYRTFQNIPLFFQSVSADDDWRDFDKNIVLSNDSGDSEMFSDGSYFIYLPGIICTDFTTMLWTGGPLYAGSDAIIQSEDGEILQVHSGYHEYGSFDTLELWKFPPGTCFAGNILPTPVNDGYGDVSILPTIIIGDGSNGVMMYGNRFISMATGEMYESFVIDLLWECSGYSGSVEQDFSDAISAYGEFLDKISEDVQATYDLAHECYLMNPEDRPWNLTVGYTPPSSIRYS